MLRTTVSATSGLAVGFVWIQESVNTAEWHAAPVKVKFSFP